MLLSIHRLHVSTSEGAEILKGIDLNIEHGEIHAIMGPNGSGKSTLAQTLMGNSAYTVTRGTLIFDGKELLNLAVDERARQGLFLAFQYPQSIPGVSLRNFLKTALKARTGKTRILPAEFKRVCHNALEILSMDPSFLERNVNDGLSGGEKKKSEILQLAVLAPRLAILDETDSGLDVDALKIVAEGINDIKKINPTLAVLVITHYQRILRYLHPDHVHVLVKGKIVMSGGSELAEELERSGYEKFQN